MMRNKFFSLLLSVCMILTMATASLAEDVYVTKYGKKYHKEGSRFIKDKDVQKLTREEAEAQGYKPSSEFQKETEKPAAADEAK